MTAASGRLIEHVAGDLPPARLTTEDEHFAIRLGVGRAGRENRHLAVASGQRIGRVVTGDHQFVDRK